MGRTRGIDLCWAIAVIWAVLAPSAAWAQQRRAGIAGVAKDVKGAPVRSVTVEVASPVLLEGVRTVVTDPRGQYEVTDLQPGTYSVTFRAEGFDVFRHDGLVLSTGFTATVNAELQDETADTVNVSGAVPFVDARNTTQRSVVSSAVTEALASGMQGAQTAASLTRGVSTAQNDVGGTAGANAAQGNSLTIHGKAGVKRLFDGLRIENAEGIGFTSYMVNSATVAETVVETGGGNAESLAAGGSINVVPRSGSNTFQYSLSGLFGNGRMQSHNLDDALRARGLTSTNRVGAIWDATATVGGPIKRDSLWFFVAPKYWGNRLYAAGVYWNKTQGSPFYTPDYDRPADQYEHVRSNPVRLTWQASPAHRFNFFVDYPQNACICRHPITTAAPEATNGFTFGGPGREGQIGLFQATWSWARTSKFLIEGGVSLMIGGWPQTYQPGVTPDTISINDIGTGFLYNDIGRHLGIDSYPEHASDRLSERVTASYTTGSHVLKMGIQLETAWHTAYNWVNHDISYQFLNGVPNGIVEYATPYLERSTNKADLGLFVQDQWTLDRLTLNYGVRFSYFNAGVPAQSVGPTRFVPVARAYAPVPCVPCWTDLDPRVGASFDVFGDGHTAVKASFGRYVTQQIVAIASANNPFNTAGSSVTRTWNDTNGDYVPDCDLPNQAQNGECGPIANVNFGLNNANATRYAADVISGFGRRPYVWDSSVEVQHQLTPTVSVNGGYYRNWAGNFSATANTLVTPEDYTSYCVTAPTDPRLPGGGGYQVCGLTDIAPAKFSQVQNLVTQAERYGTQTAVNDFFGFSLNGRFTGGRRLGGSIDLGQTVTDQCFVVDSVQQLTYTADGTTYCRVVMPWSGTLQIKANGSYPLPAGFSVNATYQNTAGPQVRATWSAPNSAIAPSLGRNLAACGTRSVCTATAAVPLIEPGTVFEGRRSQLDLRFSKVVKLTSRARLQANFDVYNLFNSNAIASMQTSYGPQWLKPTKVLDARLVQVGGRLDF